jgi:hypothetical protein
MRVITLASLLVQHTIAEVYRYSLAIATRNGLPVTSWQAGDPTRVQFSVQSEFLAGLEGAASGYIGSGFLDYAVGVWQAVCAKQTFNVDILDATFATTDVVLTNTKSGVYDLDPNDLTFKNVVSGKTYHNLTGGHLPAQVGSVPGTLTVTVEADEAGSDSSAGAGEIAELITKLGSVTCSNAVAAVGSDEQQWETTKLQCRAKQDSWSPNGAKGAYFTVALDPVKSGTRAVTRPPRVYGDSDVGEVTVYLAGPSGAIAETDRALVELGILKWATPLCHTPIVLSCTNVVVDITYSLWVYKKVNKTAAEIAAAVQTALEQMFASRDIGGDIITPAPGATGKLYVSLIESTIRSVFPEVFRVVVALPAADVSLANGQVAALGVVTPTVTLVVDP